MYRLQLLGQAVQDLPLRNVYPEKCTKPFETLVAIYQPTGVTLTGVSKLPLQWSLDSRKVDVLLKNSANLVVQNNRIFWS